MKISVIFTTYNSLSWLEKVLWGFHYQTDNDFEIVVADDGSDNDTRALIGQFQTQTHRPIQHVWHPDNGFQKCEILNKAILAATGDYIVMTDGDCIPRKDFVAVHRANARVGCYLSGGYFKLPMITSQVITQEHIRKGDCFRKQWLLENGVPSSHKMMKFTPSSFLAAIYNIMTPTKRTWNGHNASCWKNDALKVNGFDARMRYGGLDVEFGLRLRNLGLRAKQIRYYAVCVHLDHARGYRNEKDMQFNKEIRAKVKAERIVETPFGIKQLDVATAN